MGIEVPGKFDQTTEMPRSGCPYCGAQLDGATGDAASPGPGDYSLCIKCAEVMVFDDELRLPTSSEVEEFFASPELARMQAQAAAFVRARDR